MEQAVGIKQLEKGNFVWIDDSLARADHWKEDKGSDRVIFYYTDLNGQTHQVKIRQGEVLLKIIPVVKRYFLLYVSPDKKQGRVFDPDTDADYDVRFLTALSPAEDFDMTGKPRTSRGFFIEVTEMNKKGKEYKMFYTVKKVQ